MAELNVNRAEFVSCLLYTSANNVLTDFIDSGVYDRRRPFHVTTSPSMDILVSSNLERLLFDLSGENDAEVKGLSLIHISSTRTGICRTTSAWSRRCWALTTAPR